MSQNRSSAVMQQRAAAPDALDYFPTPPWATRAAAGFLQGELGEDLAGQSVWEPACGEMHMARPLGEYFASVRATDVFRYSNEHGICDFLIDGTRYEPTDWVITNPPFLLAERFIRTALERARRGVVMLVRSAFTESEDRHGTLFDSALPVRPSHVVTFAERVVMLRGRLIRANAPDPFNLDETGKPRKASTATSYSLVIWKPDEHDTRHRWIGPCRTQLERDGDYPDYAEQWAKLAAAREPAEVLL